MKFHLLAVGVICTIITVVYTVSKPDPAQTPTVDPELAAGRSVEIASATWGEGCNEFMNELNRTTRSKPVELDENGQPKPQTIYTLATYNNVLERVTNACKGQISCSITPSDDALGVTPLHSCAKQLKITYRCYSFDRLWEATIDGGQTHTIDCHAAATPAGK